MENIAHKADKGRRPQQGCHGAQAIEQHNGQRDFLSHDAGHLLEAMFGWRSNPHFGVFRSTCCCLGCRSISPASKAEKAPSERHSRPRCGRVKLKANRMKTAEFSNTSGHHP
jgi:hypothetical protein